jgi:hypothetical protein
MNISATDTCDEREEVKARRPNSCPWSWKGNGKERKGRKGKKGNAVKSMNYSGSFRPAFLTSNYPTPVGSHQCIHPSSI